MATKTPRFVNPTSPDVAGQISWITAGSAIPSGWQELSKSGLTTIVNAQALYPTLWAKYTSTTSTDPIYRSGSALVVQKMYTPGKTTKQLDITFTGSNLATILMAKAVFYADSTGIWRMRFNIAYTPTASSASETITLTNISTAGLAAGQVFSATNSTGTQAVLYSIVNAASPAVMSVAFSAASLSNREFSGDVALGAEPTTYTTPANLETPALTPIMKLDSDVTQGISFGSGSGSTSGGGLVPTAISLSDFSGSPKKFQAESGKLYTVDMAGAAEQYTISAPKGAAGVNFAIECKVNSNLTYLLAVEGNGGTENFWYNGSNQTPLKMGFIEMRVDFAWDSNDSHFLCAVSQVPISGTWSGSLDMTGTLKVDTIQEHTATKGVAIQGKTDGVAVAAGMVGEVIESTITSSFVYSGTYVSDTYRVINTQNDGLGTDLSITLSKGRWRIELISSTQVIVSGTGGTIVMLGIFEGASTNIGELEAVTANNVTLRGRGSASVSVIRTVSSDSTVYKGRVKGVDYIGTPTVSGMGTIASATSPTIIRATRTA